MRRRRELFKRPLPLLWMEELPAKGKVMTDHPAAPPRPARKSSHSAIRARLEKITPGPWVWESLSEKSNEFAVGTAFDGDGKQLLGRLPEGEWVEDAVIERRGVIGMNESGHAHFADADFIAHAPSDIASLLADLDAKDAQIAELREANNVLANECAAQLITHQERADAAESRAAQLGDSHALILAKLGMDPRATHDKIAARLAALEDAEEEIDALRASLTALAATWRDRIISETWTGDPKRELVSRILAELDALAADKKDA